VVFRPLGGVFHRHPVFGTVGLESGDAAVGVLSYNADKDTFNLTHKEQAERQAKAAYASGYKGKKGSK
jgi:hypothetical protein